MYIVLFAVVAACATASGQTGGGSGSRDVGVSSSRAVHEVWMKAVLEKVVDRQPCMSIEAAIRQLSAGKQQTRVKLALDGGKPVPMSVLRMAYTTEVAARHLQARALEERHGIYRALHKMPASRIERIPAASRLEVVHSRAAAAGALASAYAAASAAGRQSGGDDAAVSAAMSQPVG